MVLPGYQAMSSLRNVAHDEWLCTFAKQKQLEAPSARSWAAPVKATGTVRKRQAVHGPSITCKITPTGSLSSSQPGGPPAWASLLAFGLSGDNISGWRRRYTNLRLDARKSRKCSGNKRIFRGKSRDQPWTNPNVFYLISSSVSVCISRSAIWIL